MAFLDFLGKDVGGSVAGATPQGFIGPGAPTGATGVNWGQLLSQAAGGYQQPQAMQFGQGLGPSQYPGSPQPPSAPLPQAPFQPPTAKGKQSDTDDLMSIVRIFTSLFGVPI